MWKMEKGLSLTELREKKRHPSPAKLADANGNAPPTPSLPEGVMRIISRLQQAGFQACLAGGCVRDFLLGKTAHDWDVATSALPEQVQKIFPRTVAVGKEFGIILVIENDQPCEVATFRTDGKYTDGRHPEKIFFASLEEDVKRRDFTINAMLYDPRDGTLHDYVNGQQDLKKRVLRAVGDPSQRFAEDKLRMLRAIRFAANLQFTIAPDTWQAICAEAPKINLVSKERVAAELEKMLLGGHSATALRLLLRCGLLEQLLPSVAALQDVEQPPEFHPEGDVWQHTLIMLEEWDKTLRDCSEDPVSPRFKKGRLARASQLEKRTLAWAVLLHDIGKPDTYIKTDRIRFNGHDCLGAKLTKEILNKLKLPGDVIEGASDLVGLHMSLSSFPQMRLATRRRRLQHPRFPLLLELHRLDCMGSHKIISLHQEIMQAWHEEQARPPTAKPLLNGNDLLQMGIKPGPIFKIILKAVQDEMLENSIDSREQALLWVKQKFLEKEK
jgi:putative nucleotidyltransferase with HDIG domain